MPLAPGTRLGPYEIVSPAGAGGMGEVYRARDTRLGREVAVKVLPAQVAGNPERRQRLDREARAISSLSHPHICPLYDVGHQDGVDFLVMAYLEGETLAERLARGPLPPEQVLRHGIEIAGALESAHRRGIVHRDLKPGNVMLTRTGARLLDFGLAKPAPVEAGSQSTVAAPLVASLTAAGTLIGTFQYMSPEQVEGREADARSDIFALGAVLYEMATGRRAFHGETTASLIAAILEREPPAISTLQPLAPPALDDLVRGCLVKDPEERWQTAHDVRLQLQALRNRASAPDVRPLPQRRTRHELIAWSVAALSLLAVVALAGVLARREERTTPLTRASLLPPAGYSFVPHEFALAPDGRRLAFVASGPGGVSTLWVSAFDSAQPAEISGTEGAAWPFWSPDGRWIAFFARGKLMRIEPGGTGLQAICDVGLFGRPGAWSPDGQILFVGAVLGPLLAVRNNGGRPSAVTSIPPDTPGEAHRFPQFLPDGRRFLYVASWTNDQRGGVYLASLDGRAAKLVSSEIRSRMLLVGDELLFIRGGTLYAQPFDTRRGELGMLAFQSRAVSVSERNGTLELGNAVPLFQTRIVRPNFVLFQYDVSSDGQQFLINSLPRAGAAAPLTVLVDWREELTR